MKIKIKIKVQDKIKILKQIYYLQNTKNHHKFSINHTARKIYIRVKTKIKIKIVAKISFRRITILKIKKVIKEVFLIEFTK